MWALVLILSLGLSRYALASLFGEQHAIALPFAHDDERIRAALLNRRLEDNIAVAQPDEVCVAYNEALAGLMTCSCERFGRTDVKIFCVDIAETCVPGSCVLRTIETIITSTSLSRATTSCTNSTTMADLYTCVQIIPIAPGNYGGIDRCAATLNGDRCSSCSECMNQRNTATNSTAITVNCCNVKEDAIQTCGVIGPLGSFVSNYDPIPAGSEGTCSGSALSSNVSFLVALIALCFSCSAFR